MKRRYIYRSATTGRYVTEKWAKAHPETTMRMTQRQDRELCETGCPAARARELARSGPILNSDPRRSKADGLQSM